MKKYSWLLSYALLAIGLACFDLTRRDNGSLSFAVSSSQLKQIIGDETERNKRPDLESEFVSGNLTKEVHSATAMTLSDGQLLLFWYGGEREGSADVSIYSRRFDINNGLWGAVNEVVKRQEVVIDLQRNIRKLGNPIAFEYKKNEIWLFFVTVSVGGWAGSSINVQKSFDNGITWTKPERLISSPFFNISTLVKERPIRYQDGTIGLPVYHEFLGKFAELLHLNATAEVINKYRISDFRQAIQPVIIPQNESHGIAFMRNVDEHSRHKIWISETLNGGKSWQKLQQLELPNPNAAVTTIALDSPQDLLMVFNNHPSERDDLTLAYSSDAGKNWQTLYEFEKETDSKEHNPFSYPFLLRTNNGQFHLFYTWKTQHIKYVEFSRKQLLQWMENTQKPSDAIGNSKSA